MKRLPAILIFVLYTSAFSADSDSLFIPDNANFIVYNRGGQSLILNRSKYLTSSINKNLEKFAAGRKIVHLSDDPAGSAVSEKMITLVNQFKIKSINDESLKDFYNTVDSAISEDQKILRRMKSLVIKASSSILNRDDRKIVQTEIDQLKKQINMNAGFSLFNRNNIIPELTTDGLGISSIDVINDISGSADMIDKAEVFLTRERITTGVKENILSFRIEGKWYNYISFLRSESMISNADIEEKLSDLTKNSVLIKFNYGLILLHR